MKTVFYRCHVTHESRQPSKSKFLNSRKDQSFPPKSKFMVTVAARKQSQARINRTGTVCTFRTFTIVSHKRENGIHKVSTLNCNIVHVHHGPWTAEIYTFYTPQKSWLSNSLSDFHSTPMIDFKNRSFTLISARFESSLELTGGSTPTNMYNPASSASRVEDVAGRYPVIVLSISSCSLNCSLV